MVLFKKLRLTLKGNINTFMVFISDLIKIVLIEK